eukprot:9516824-Alexandrium_andersonii.AAC.1
MGTISRRFKEPRTRFVEPRRSLLLTTPPPSLNFCWNLTRDMRHRLCCPTEPGAATNHASA